jgi:hypothetical protein
MMGCESLFYCHVEHTTGRRLSSVVEPAHIDISRACRQRHDSGQARDWRGGAAVIFRTVTELTIAVIAPGSDCAIGQQRQNMAVPCGYCADPSQARDGYGSRTVGSGSVSELS